ncbi:MAG: hypothetical protein H3C47_05995, partial [Candidatus Cloacimonetes bacterium]|nr:hypothetical protein [Candidatus Cloacimonadota bacterium]
MSGCGGGGGGGGAGNNQGSAGQPGTGTNNAQSVVAASISGNLTALANSGAQASISKAFAPILFSKQNITITDTRAKINLEQVTIRLEAQRNDPLNPALTLPAILLAETVSNADGSYNLAITESSLSKASCGAEACKSWQELLTLPNPAYRLKISFVRGSGQRADSIESSVQFRPVYNNTPLTMGQASQIRLDATINMLDQKNTRLEIASTLGTLIVESNIDTSGNNIAASTPLVVFRQTVGSGSEQRTILEVDGNGDGVFGEADDAVPGRVFLEPQDLDKPEFQTFLDKPLTTFIDTNNSGKPSVVNFDTTAPVLQFVSPLPSQVLAKQPITIRLQYGDDLGFQLSTLKISTSAGLKITNPFEQIPAGATGISALTGKFRKERLDFTQVQTGALKTLATSSWMLGEATFVIPEPLTAWGPGTVTLTASIENFSSNATLSTVTQSITFSVDGPPEFIDPFLSINTAEGATYNGLSNQPVQELTARDVMPVTVRYEVIPASDASRMGWLSLNLGGLLTPISLSAQQNPVVTVTSSMLQEPTTKILKMYFSGTVPQNFKNPPQIRVTVRDADGNQSSRTIGLTVRTENVTPEWVSICSIPKNNSNLFSLNPQLVCTSSALANQSGLANCQSGGIGQLSFPEREPATIVLCAYDEDLEDRARFTPVSITYTDPTQPNLPSTNSLQGSNPLVLPGTELASKQFRLLRSSTGTFVLTASNAGTITWFDWTPPSIYGLSTTQISWRMGDGIVTLPLITSILDVITVPDAPVLSSLSASGSKTNNEFYASNGLSTLAGIDEFRPYLSDLNQPINLSLLPKRINARQGELYSLTLFAEDDETPLPQVSLFDSVFVSDSSGTILTDTWLKRQTATGEDRFRKAILSGTPTNADALKTMVVTVVTTDPTLESNPVSRFYRIPIEILDQNDPPRFSAIQSDALTNIPATTAAQSSESVTITINATEDQLLRFYIHAFDTDPVGSPFRDASRFVFSRNEDQLNTKISKMEVTTSASDPSRVVALFEWRPESRDTNESIPEGVNQVRQNRMQVIVRALCPTDLFFGTTCLEPSRTIDINLNVQAVDDPPIFDRLTVNGSIQANPSAPIRLTQGQTVDLLQFVREEEAGQLLDQIQIINPDATLSFLLNGVSRSLNDGNPLGSSIRMQGVPSNDSVDYVERTIDGVVQFVPKTVSLSLRAVPRGSSVISTRVLSFEIEDGPDAPTFTGLPNPAIYTVDERQSLDLTLVATNTLDKNPAFKTGFIFRSVTNQLPNPVGNFQVFSSSTSSQNTTGRLVWTPGTEHTNGVNDKSHTVGIEVCLQASPTTCRQQQIVINVRAVDDPPQIFWGAQGRDLVANPFTVNNPFTVQENSSFSQIVKAIDPDGERVGITAEFKLVSPSQVPGQYTTIVAGVPLIGAGSGKTADIVPITNTPSEQNPAPDINGFQPPAEMTVGWNSIDWQSISTSAALPSTALYELTIRAVPVGSAITEVKLPILLQSVNDAPSFTTSVIPGFVGQNSLAGTVVATLTDLISDEENHPVRFTITNRFGNTQNFVEPLLVNGNQVVLSAVPGENNVGTHQIEVRADEEGIDDPLTTVRVLSFLVRDSNDAPFFVNSFESAQNVQEGSTSVLSIGIIDRDLASSPQSEALSYIFEYSLNSSPFVTMSFQSTGSGTSTTFSTALPYNIAWTTMPVSPVSGQTGLNVTVNPSSLPDFASRTLVMKILATDSFESQLLSTQTSLTYVIRPVDDIPQFTHLQSVTLTPGASFSQICFDNPCTESGRIVRQSQSRSFHMTSYNAESNTVDPVMFQFASLFGSTVLSTTPVGVSLISTTNISANTASATFQISPTNSQIGLNRLTLLVEDKTDNDINSVNIRQFSTHTLGWFVQDLADPPTIVNIRCLSEGCVYTTSGVVEILEDIPFGLEITLTDPDLFSPKSFAPEEVQFMQSVMGLSVTSINQIASTLFASEYFEYVLTNLTPFPGFRISSVASPTTTLFAFSTPSNLVLTSTTSVIQMQWSSPTDQYTFPKLGQNITWNFRARSFAANSIDSTRPSSVSTGVVVRVIPVNDRPAILNTQTEAQATEGLPFTFQVVATDEEEANLNYLFDGQVPGNMSVSPAGLIQWLPTNDDTANDFYDIRVFVQDNGKVSSASLDTTTPLSSGIYSLRVFLTDVDAPAIHDSVYTPATTAVEDLLYAAQIRFTDQDKFDIPHYFLEYIRRNGQPITSNFNVQEVDNSVDGNGRGPVQITWTPALSGTYDIRLRVSSVKNAIVRSSVFYDFQVQVEEVNDPPVFAPIDPSPLFENVPYIRNIVITDEDGDIPVLSLGGSPGCSMPSFLQLSAVERRISGGTNLSGFEDQEVSLGTTPLQTYQICLEANDGQITTTYAYVLNIRASNNPPTIVRMYSKAGSDPVSNQLEQSQILESVEPISALPIQNRRITLREDLTNQITLEFYNEEGDQPQVFNLAQGPVGVSLNTTQSTSKTALLTLTWTPGSSHVTKAPDGTPVPGKTPILFRITGTDNRSAATSFEFEADVLDNPTKPCVRLVNASCVSNPTTATIFRNVNEDQIQSLFLDAVDFDPNSTLSYSIVTSLQTNPHPVSPIYLHNVANNPRLKLELASNGNLTFLAEVSEANILGTTAGVRNMVPVTFSICGTSRLDS